MSVDRRAARTTPTAVLVAAIVAGAAVVVAFFALVGFCLWQGLDLEPVLQAINGPFGLVSAIGIVVNTFQIGRVRAQAGRTEALAGREGPSVVREQVTHVDAGVQELRGDVGRLHAVLEQALGELGRAAVAQRRGNRRQDTGVVPVVPGRESEQVLEPVLREDGHPQLYATAIPPDVDAEPLPTHVQVRYRASLAEQLRDFHEREDAAQRGESEAP